jgi:hypothetical protein
MGLGSTESRLHNNSNIRHRHSLIKFTSGEASWNSFFRNLIQHLLPPPFRTFPYPFHKFMLYLTFSFKIAKLFTSLSFRWHDVEHRTLTPVSAWKQLCCRNNKHIVAEQDVLVTFLACILGVMSSNLGGDADYPGSIFGFPQSRLEVTGMNTLN